MIASIARTLTLACYARPFLAFVNQVVGTNAVLSASVTNTGSAAISSALFRGMKKGAQRGI